MSHVYEGPIAGYNSLHDDHLSTYFDNSRIRKHLVKVGLITKDGRLVPEEQYRVQLARREHKRLIKDMISQAIVQRTLEVERQRQAEIKKKLEEIAKLELVKRVRASRGRRGDEEVLQFLLPLPSSEKRGTRASARAHRNYAEGEEGEEYLTPTDQNQDDSYVHDRNFDCFAHLRRKSGKSAYPKDKIETINLTNLDRNAIEEYSEVTRDIDTLPALPPYNRANLRKNRQRSVSPKRRMGKRSVQLSRASSLHRPGSLVVLHEAKIKSLCEVTMKFLGCGGTGGPASASHEVSIDQQHCGGNTLTVFRENLSEGDVFTFVSRRHLDFPFSLTIYVDGKTDCRLSTCCEYKHNCGQKLGGPHGHFRLQEVRGAAPCYKCEAENHHRKNGGDRESSNDEVDTKARNVSKMQKQTSATKHKRKRSSKTDKRTTIARSGESEQNISTSTTSNSRQQVVVRLPDDDEPQTEVSRGDSAKETKRSVMIKNNITTAKSATKSKTDGSKTAVHELYDQEEFEDDTEEEPDDRSVAITTPVIEHTNPPFKPQPPQAPKPLTRSHPVVVQKPNDNTSLLATLAQASVAEEIMSRNSDSLATTAIVKLPAKLGVEEPSSPVHVKQLSFQKTTSTHQTVTTGSKRAVEEQPANNLANSSVTATPALTPVLTPVISTIVSPSPSNAEMKEIVSEQPISPQQPPQNRSGSSILKKSVSFNEVREERQISDDEQTADTARSHGSRQSENAIEAEPVDRPSIIMESDDEEDDPNAVANHEAALALEDQAKATEDRTPFLQPDSTVLDINKRTLNDRQVRRLCAEILNSDRLEKIVIRESGLNDGMVQRICDALQHSSNSIRLLCLNLNAISAAGIVHVVQLLHAKPSIKMVLLYGNPLGDNGLNALVDGIFGDLPEELVSQLAAQGINIPSQNDDTPIRTQLTHLDLGEIGISSAGAIKLSKLLEKLTTLRVLNLGGNHNVGLEGWSAISKCLSDKAYPAKLCLSHCRLGNKCTSELATALRTNSGVEHIDLEGCGIGEEGGRALLEFVESEPRKLENIVLTDNRIPDRLMNRIEEGLRKLRGEETEED